MNDQTELDIFLADLRAFVVHCSHDGDGSWFMNTVLQVFPAFAIWRSTRRVIKVATAPRCRKSKRKRLCLVK